MTGALPPSWHIPVLILAGGLGTRLQPVLGQTPKVLAPIAGKPFLGYMLDLLERQGFRRVTLCLGHGAEAVASYASDGSAWGMAITCSVEPQPLGTAGAVRHALAAGRVDSNVLVLNGDTYPELDFAALIGFHRQKRAVATLALVHKDDTRDGGTVELVGDGRIVGFQEKSPAARPGLVSAGVYVFSPTIVERIPAGQPSSLERQTFPALVQAHEPIFGHVSPGAFYDIGTPERYRAFEQHVLASAPQSRGIT